jgi:hypothetical protein
MLTPDQAVSLAERALRERFGEADAAFAAGSIVRGRGLPLSDIDLVVLYGHVANSWREAFMLDGVPIEAWVHDSETLAFRLEADRQLSGPALFAMLAEGVIIGPRPAEALAWRERARAMLAEGPPPTPPEWLRNLRYAVTDRVDDLRDARPPQEVQAIAVALYFLLSELILSAGGEWLATSKWIPRRLEMLDPALEKRFSAAFGELFSTGDARAVIALTEELLQPHGGFLFDGYRSDAPATARTPAPDA